MQYSKLHWDSARGDAGGAIGDGGIGDGGGGDRVPAAGLTTRATRARCRKTDIGTQALAFARRDAFFVAICSVAKMTDATPRRRLKLALAECAEPH